MARTKQTPTRVGVSTNKSTPAKPPVGVRKRHSYRPRLVALREVRRHQKSTEPLIPKAPFQSFVRGILQGIMDDMKTEGRIQHKILIELQNTADGGLPRRLV